MARLLVVGGGCRALTLTRAVREEGHAVRIVTRDAERRAAIEEAGGECVIGDPDRIGSLRYALDNVTLLLWLLGTASGGNVEHLHGSRWEMMLWRTIDTTVRGVVYEAAGSVAPPILDMGVRLSERMSRENEIPLRLLRTDPRDAQAWARDARAAVDALL